MSKMLVKEHEIDLAWSLRNKICNHSRYNDEKIRLAGEQNWRCCWCHQPMKIRNITIEHIIPRSLGGAELINIAIAHSYCNHKRPTNYKELIRVAELFDNPVNFRRRKISESNFISDDYCASCSSYIRDAREIGFSRLYFPGNKSILLCVACCRAEEDMIETEGTNNLPSVIEQYIYNINKIV